MVLASGRRALAALAVLAAAGCAPTAAPRPASGPEAAVASWRRDLGVHAAERRQFIADTRQLREDYLEIQADPSYPGAEARVRDAAARSAAGERTGAGDLLVRALYTLSLGELTVFQRLLALSTRVATLEAARSELEAQRMELRLRRFELERAWPPAAGLLRDTPEQGTPPFSVVEPVPWPLACERYVVGDLVLASCR